MLNSAAGHTHQGAALVTFDRTNFFGVVGYSDLILAVNSRTTSKHRLIKQFDTSFISL